MFGKNVKDPQKELADTYNRLFNTTDGKIVWDDLELFCGFKQSSVREIPIDVNQTIFNEGKRRVYLRMNSFIDISNAGKGKENDRNK